MAVNVDTVYQKVLAVANKEQRGYVTPLEFNLLANQAQMDIFEQYFYDINQFDRLLRNDTEYSDPLLMFEEKISIFKVRYANLTVVNEFGYIDLNADLPDLYRLGTVKIDRANVPDRAQVVEHMRDGKEHLLYESNPLTEPMAQFHTNIRGRVLENSVYNRYDEGIRIYPYPDWDTTTLTSPDTVQCNYIKTPNQVAWGYDVIGEKALYNGGTSTDFELHVSEETSLVNKILTLAGVTMDKPNLTSVAASQENIKTQQEKQ